MTRPVVIGEPGDDHVRAVLELVPTAVVFDFASLAGRSYEYRPGHLVLDSHSVGEGTGTGWIRRIAPQDWFHGVESDSADAAVKTAWLTLGSAILRSLTIDWVSDVDSIVRAENKLVAGIEAARAGIRTPRTIVTNDITILRDEFPEDVLIKPLGPGHYYDGGSPYSVFAQRRPAQRLSAASLKAAPFLFQEPLDAVRHHRIVTVGGEVWGASLVAAGLPVDWRSDASAHTSFVAETVNGSLARDAVAMAELLHLGYSSQDWIETIDELVLLDVNPSGQWLFLPDKVSTAVTRALAEVLLDE